MTATISHTHFVSRAEHECVRRVFGDQSEAVPPCSVLVVEDDEDMRLCFKHLFRLPGLQNIRMEQADSVNQAMALIAMQCRDIAILDYRLGDGTAAELVRQWRDFGYEIPFLVVSGFYDVEQEMRELGATGFIHKSELTAESMAKAIRRTLDSYWTARARAGLAKA